MPRNRVAFQPNSPREKERLKKAIMDHETFASEKAGVAFSMIEIIELPYTLGDNPSVSGGPPITPSWIAQKRTCMDLEFFEKHRPLRRSRKDIFLSKEFRKRLMLNSGYSQKEIVHATKAATLIRRQRMETLYDLRLKMNSMCFEREIASSPSRSQPAAHVQDLPPSPIIPRRSPNARQRFPESSPTLQFPHLQPGSIQPPRCTLSRKRAAPTVTLGLFGSSSCPSNDQSLSSTPKRLRSPRSAISLNESPSTLSPSPSRLKGTPMRPNVLPPRAKSPIPDARPLVPPQRLPSPPPALLLSPYPRSH